jgi:hypothetical protein
MKTTLRDGVLNLYPAVSLLGLLLVWLTGLVVGWTLIYRGLGTHPGGAHDWETPFYYAGASLLTPAFGTAHGLPTRLLTLTEALTALGTIALLISYLPALYGGYSKREACLLTLDDPIGGRLTPVRIIATHAADQNLELLYRFFAEWELWTAEVLESHGSTPCSPSSAPSMWASPGSPPSASSPTPPRSPVQPCPPPTAASRTSSTGEAAAPSTRSPPASTCRLHP